MANGAQRGITSNDSINPNVNQQMNMKGPLLVWFITVVILLAIWDGVWKLIAMWKSARNEQLGWYICLAIFNTIGILPILYILFFQKTGTPMPPKSS